MQGATMTYEDVRRMMINESFNTVGRAQGTGC
jgi:hypothetical protein